jgi:hypothetical protein
MVARNRHGMTLWEGVCAVREKRDTTSHKPAFINSMPPRLRDSACATRYFAYASIDRRTTINSMSLCPLRALSEKNLCIGRHEMRRGAMAYKGAMKCVGAP